MDKVGKLQESQYLVSRKIPVFQDPKNRGVRYSLTFRVHSKGYSTSFLCLCVCLSTTTLALQTTRQLAIKTATVQQVFEKQSTFGIIGRSILGTILADWSGQQSQFLQAGSVGLEEHWTAQLSVHPPSRCGQSSGY